MKYFNFYCECTYGLSSVIIIMLMRIYFLHINYIKKFLFHHCYSHLSMKCIVTLEEPYFNYSGYSSFLSQSPPSLLHELLINKTNVFYPLSTCGMYIFYTFCEVDYQNLDVSITCPCTHLTRAIARASNNLRGQYDQTNLASKVNFSCATACVNDILYKTQQIINTKYFLKI